MRKAFLLLFIFLSSITGYCQSTDIKSFAMGIKIGNPNIEKYPDGSERRYDLDLNELRIHKIEPIANLTLGFIF